MIRGGTGDDMRFNPPVGHSTPPHHNSCGPSAPHGPTVPNPLSLDLRKSNAGFSPNGMATAQPACKERQNCSARAPLGGSATIATPPSKVNVSAPVCTKGAP